MSQIKHEQLTNALKKLPDADKLISKYLATFSEDYLIDYSVEDIISDIMVMETLSGDNEYAIRFGVTNNSSNKNLWQIKLFKLNDQVSLSRGLPIIENFGFKLIDEHPYTSHINNTTVIHICDFGVEVPAEVAKKIDDKDLSVILRDAIVSVFNRQVENDALNKLVLFSGLTAREVTLIRAITHYFTQTTLPFSRQYIADTLKNFPKIARNLFLLFEAKFDLKLHNLDTAKKITEEILDEINSVTNLDDDRILKAFLTTIEAMLRTNFYQLDANAKPKEYSSFKLQSAKLPFLPKPLPLYEIFVYSMRFEAIHLRAGKVARGGFRWSDRREDFRTEILGLVKAQVVKNSVIVPTGSKGGFVCKKLPPITDRDAYMAEGVACYKSFISGLLDITDNLVAGKIVPPKDVVRYDGDDPYLVVAADKGTATFSDYANEMSHKYGFWLGDAFASGGSAGYDHKKMGITARGAWEATKRHFRHLGVDTQKEDFSVIGIGDMAGDVFGNGMLLSEYICLLAAFNHQHIFLDPKPNSAVSFSERQRMFNLPRSTWADYDKSKISNGGGIFERSLKQIPLSIEVREWLNVKETELSPNELINLILKAPADLLYNGGIGTYIKSETESHEAVKDKANDAIRVNGNDLQVKVVVEGGNLGATQLGRIEFAQKGGLILTDAIDNSAGVDCSDHEVNIKILFADIMQKTGMSVEERNEILEAMTDNVAKLVLRDNYLQTQILSYADARAHELFAINVNFIEKLEKHGELDRKVEFLPSYQEITERQRAGEGLTSPELAVLLAYSKMSLDKQILSSNLLKDNTFDSLLINYFPETLQTKYSDYIRSHYLRPEIISTQLSNLIVNRMGITFVSRFEDEFRCDVSLIVQAFWAVYNLFDAEAIFAEIESLDNKVDANLQVDMLIRVKKFLERTIRWVMRRFKNGKQMVSLIDKYSNDITELVKSLPQTLGVEEYKGLAGLQAKLLEANVTPHLAEVVTRSSAMPQLLDIVILADETNHKVASVAKNYFYLGRMLRMDWLRKNLIALPENNKWQALSRSALLADGYGLYSGLIKDAMNSAPDSDNFAVSWLAKEQSKVKLLNDMFDELQSYKTLDLAMLSAAVREIGTIFA